MEIALRYSQAELQNASSRIRIHAGEFSRALAEEWAQKTGNKVEYIFSPQDVSEALQVYLQF